MLRQLYWTPWGASSAQKQQSGLSRKTGEGSRGWVKQEGAESPTELRPLSRAAPYNQVTRSAGRM